MNSEIGLAASQCLALQAEQDQASEYSSMINSAYTTLKSPLQRAKYVVMLHTWHAHGLLLSQVRAELSKAGTLTTI